MGGIGSGRTSPNATVEQSLPLDVNELGDCLRSPGSTGSVRWSTGHSITISMVGDDDGRATALRLESDNETLSDDVVSIKWQPMHLGGHRPWFHCPGCGDRRGKLYLPPSGTRFCCRECHSLGYRSERADPLTRKRLAFQKIHAQIDGRRPAPCDYLAPPDKPPNMHQSTYESLAADLEAAFADWQGQFQTRRAEILG